MANEVHPEKLWKALTKEDTLVCASTPSIRNAERIGLYGNHAYTLVEAMEDKAQGIPKLVKVRNPWGDEKEWKGAWSKESQELNR